MIKRRKIPPAEYSRKKEARAAVSIMACIEIFGNRFIFENVSIETSKYETWTKESVRKMSDEYEQKMTTSSDKNREELI